MLDNTAYDYELFEPKKQKSTLPEVEVKALPKKKKSAINSGKLTKSEIKRYSILFAIGILLFGGFVAAKANYYELNNQYISSQTELKQLQSEYVCLEVEYESNVSVSNIEEYAIDVLGMQVPDTNQIKYITLTQEDRYEIKGDKVQASIIAIDPSNIF